MSDYDSDDDIPFKPDRRGYLYEPEWWGNLSDGVGKGRETEEREIVQAEV